MNEQELNKRRAEWAGIRYEPDQDVFKVIFPDGSWYNIGHDWILDEIEPDFPNDLNACFKWLVPDNCSVCFNRSKDSVVCLLTIPKAIGYGSDVYTGKAEANKDALAFCKAKDKRIDCEVERRQQ